MPEPGTILCYKTTGELCIVIDRHEGYEGVVKVRRPVMTHDNGIQQTLETANLFELETVEQHLRREASEMLLKTRIQDELMDEIENSKKAKVDKLLVN